MCNLSAADAIFAARDTRVFDVACHAPANENSLPGESSSQPLENALPVPRVKSERDRGQRAENHGLEKLGKLRIAAAESSYPEEIK